MQAAQYEGIGVRVVLEQGEVAQYERAAGLQPVGAAQLRVVPGASSTHRRDLGGGVTGALPRQVDHEVGVQVRDVGHSALTGQPDLASVACLHPEVVGGTATVDLGGPDHLMGHQAALVIPVVGLVPAGVCGGELVVELFVGRQ